MGLMNLFTKKKASASAMSVDPAKRSAALREEAMKNAREARERLGDETIQKIAATLNEQSAGKKAQRELQVMDKGTIADHLKTMLDEK